MRGEGVLRPRGPCGPSVHEFAYADFDPRAKGLRERFNMRPFTLYDAEAVLSEYEQRHERCNNR